MGIQGLASENVISPIQVHQRGAESGLSVFRLLAQI